MRIQLNNSGPSNITVTNIRLDNTSVTINSLSSVIIDTTLLVSSWRTQVSGYYNINIQYLDTLYIELPDIYAKLVPIIAPVTTTTTVLSSNMVGEGDAIQIIVNLTSISTGSVTIEVYLIDTIANTKVVIYTSAAMTGTGTFVYLVTSLPETYQVSLVPAGGASIVASVNGSLLQE